MTTDTLVPDPVECAAETGHIDAQRVLLDRPGECVLAIAFASDLEDLAAAAIVERVVSAPGKVPRVLRVHRGEHVHHPDRTQRIEAAEAPTLVVGRQHRAGAHVSSSEHH